MKKEEIPARGKEHWNFILGMMCVSMLMSGCAGSSSEKKKNQLPHTNPTEFAEETEKEDDTDIEIDKENLTDTDTQETEDSSSQDGTMEDDWTEDGDGGFREITDSEKEELTNFVHGWDAYGFLMSEYTIPEEVSLGEVFYSGVGASEDISSDEIKAYLKACNQEELFTECRKIIRRMILLLIKRMENDLQEGSSQ